MDGIKAPKEVLLSVGQRYPEWQTGQDGFQLEWSDTGFILFAMLGGVKPEEKEKFAVTKKMTVRYTVIEDVCYFTFRFGDIPWSDCPFSPALYRAAGQNPVFPELGESEGFSLTVLLIDTATGELCAARLIGLGHDFSARWREWAIRAAETPLDYAEYSKRVDRAYTAYAPEDFAVKGVQEGNQYIVE